MTLLPPPAEIRGCRIYHLRQTSSTQTWARRLAEDGEPAWTLIRADRQSRGRGRMDRRWSSGPGGLYFSLILRPKMEPSELPGLSLALGEACAGALGKLAGIDTAVKPPNDVLGRPKHPDSVGLGRPEAAPFGCSGRTGTLDFRKICGILIEASGDSKTVHWLAAGIGVNVNNRLPKTLAEASSLAELTGRRFDLSDVFDAVLEGLRQTLDAAARSS